jgi:hypothetical protein
MANAADHHDHRGKGCEDDQSLEEDRQSFHDRFEGSAQAARRSPKSSRAEEPGSRALNARLPRSV